MAPRKRPQRRPASDLQKLASESDFVWDKENQRHNWECPKCNETISATPHGSRVRLSQFAMENSLKTISAKAMGHLARNCGPEPRPAYRRDLDN